MKDITMKIKSVDVMELKIRDDRNHRPIVCRVNTDEGIHGYGEAAMAYGVGASAAFGMVRDLAGCIIGMDPLDNEVIWEKLYKTTFWGQNGAPWFLAASARLISPCGTLKGNFSMSLCISFSEERKGKS